MLEEKDVSKPIPATWLTDMLKVVLNIDLAGTIIGQTRLHVELFVLRIRQVTIQTILQKFLKNKRKGEYEERLIIEQYARIVRATV